MMKTVMVAVDRVAVVPKYKVTVRRTKKLMAHDERGECLLGDTVRVESCRPLSKRKTWVVSEILRRERTLGGGGGGGGSGGEAAAAAVACSSPFSSSAPSSSSRGFAASAAFRRSSSSL
jgi:small subunit ribosomal protein S17